MDRRPHGVLRGKIGKKKGKQPFRFPNVKRAREVIVHVATAFFYTTHCSYRVFLAEEFINQAEVLGRSQDMSGLTTDEWIVHFRVV